MDYLSFFLSSFITLFIVIDPILAAPIFTALTRYDSKKEKLNIAIQASVTAFCILFFFAFFGDFILHHMGISLAAFRFAGGLLLFLMGFNMFFKPDDIADSKKPGPNASARENIALFPLGIPVLAGPGSIATVMLLIANVENNFIISNILIFLAIFFCLLIAVIVCYYSSAVSKYLGRTGMNMISRILGIFLMALSVQYLFDGIKDGILNKI